MKDSFTTYQEVIRFVHEGNILGFRNNTGSTIKAGSVVVKNNVRGITVRDVANGEIGNIRVPKSPVFEAPLDPEAEDNYAFGVEISWDAVNSVVVPAGTEFAVPLGYAVSGAGGSGGTTEIHNGINASTAAAAAGDSLIRFVLASGPALEDVVNA